MLKGKKILVGVTGGIAAYKSCSLVRLFVKNGAEVKVIMTPSAVNFVSPLTLSVLSRNEVIINMFPDEKDFKKSETVGGGTWHINLGLWADILVIAPATANTIAKINAGISDNFLLSVVLAARCKILLVPSMDEDMLKNKITRNNLKSLENIGYYLMEPAKGELASGLYGEGRMPEPEEIFGYVQNLLKKKKDLEGCKVLITAGPTREKIDPVRFISNYSTGRMGFEIAGAAFKRGADVILISGPSSLETFSGIKRINVESADEMFSAVKKNIKDRNLVIMSAAVSDFKPVTQSKNKIKKENLGTNISFDFEKNIDILQYLGDNKKNYVLFGFALETDKTEKYARNKLISKHLDAVILNNPLEKGSGFATLTNKITIISKNYIKRLPLMSKKDAAEKILDFYANKFIKS